MFLRNIFLMKIRFFVSVINQHFSYFYFFIRTWNYFHKHFRASKMSEFKKRMKKMKQRRKWKRYKKLSKTIRFVQLSRKRVRLYWITHNNEICVYKPCKWVNVQDSRNCRNFTKHFAKWKESYCEQCNWTERERERANIKQECT